MDSTRTRGARQARSAARSRRPRRSTRNDCRSPGSACVADLGEQPLELPEPHTPPVIPPHVLATVPAERLPQPRVADEQLETLDELVTVRVPQTAVAAD